MSIDNARAVVLAAGKGTRMKSDRAKVLHEVLGAPMVRYVLDSAEAAGITDITLVVGHQADAVRAALGDRYRYVTQAEQKGTGHAVDSCREAFRGFDGDVVVLNGDAPLVPPELIRGLVEVRRKASASAVLLTACLEDPRGYGRVLRDAEGRFVRIAEELDASDKERCLFESNAGAYSFQAKDLFEALGKVQSDNKKGEYYLTDVPGILSSAGKQVETLRSAEPTQIFGINSRRDLVAATNFLRWRVLEAHMDSGVTIVDPSTTLIEAGVEIGEDTIVEPYCIIRRGCRIGKGCHVGPFSHLRGGAVLRDRAEIGNFVEVKNSVIGERSKAKHLAYLGDAELGSDVNIGAGTITANYDGVKKHKTVIGDGVQTGSNTVLVAPVTVGKGAKTGAGAVVTRGEVSPGSVVAGVPARPLKGSSAGDKAKGERR